MARALLIEDSPALRTTFSEYLQVRGIEVYAAYSASDARTLLPALKPEATMLDLDLHDGDGLNLIDSIKKVGSRCLIVATSAEAKDRVRALSLGADDYVAKPLEMEEIYLRLRNLLADPRPHGADAANLIMDINGVRIDPLTRAVLGEGGQPGAELTTTELALLRALAEHMDHLVSKQTLFVAIKGRSYAPNTRALDVGVSRLRLKLKQSRAGVEIHSVRQAGYMMSLGAPPATRTGS